MSNWRLSVAAVAMKLTGTSANSWRKNIQLIADGGTNARESIEIWAASFGISRGNWRDNLAGICETVTGITPRNWREAWRLLADSDFDMTVAFFIAPPPRQPNTIYRVLADGVITANNVVMA